MDDRRFDDLTRALSRTPSRRAFLTALAGAALGAVGLGAAEPNVAAGGRRPKPPQPTRCRNDAQCGACQTCQSRRCASRPDGSRPPAHPEGCVECLGGAVVPLPDGDLSDCTQCLAGQVTPKPDGYAGECFQCLDGERAPVPDGTTPDDIPVCHACQAG